MSAIEKLLIYQEEDKKLVEIERKLKESDSRKKGIQAQRFLSTVSETISGIEVKSQELCVNYEKALEEFKVLVEENAEFQTIIEKVNDEKEIAYLKNQAVALQKKHKDLMEKVSRIEQEMNDVARQYAKLKKETIAYQEQYKKSKDDYEKEKVAIEPERKAIEAKLKEIALDIPSDIMNTYKEKRKDKHFPIVYKLAAKDNHCSACGTELSMKQLDALKKEDTVIECENCRRLIFK